MLPPIGVPTYIPQSIRMWNFNTGWNATHIIMEKAVKLYVVPVTTILDIMLALPKELVFVCLDGLGTIVQRVSIYQMTFYHLSFRFFELFKHLIVLELCKKCQGKNRTEQKRRILIIKEKVWPRERRDVSQLSCCAVDYTAGTLPTITAYLRIYRALLLSSICKIIFKTKSFFYSVFT